MKTEKTFLICKKCKNIVALIEDGGGKMSCCGEPMHVLVAGEIDAAVEKHVPVCKRAGNNLIVEVGGVAHPMTEEHYISWIAVFHKNGMYIEELHPGQAPKAEFCVGDGDVSVYAYCNLHGLWKADL